MADSDSDEIRTKVEQLSERLAVPSAAPPPVKVASGEGISATLLRSSLAVAVPMWVDKIRSDPTYDFAARAQACAEHVAVHGDIILYRAKKPGDSARAFNHLAEGLALASFVPGGVTFLGDHYEQKQRTI